MEPTTRPSEGAFPVKVTPQVNKARITQRDPSVDTHCHPKAHPPMESIVLTATHPITWRPIFNALDHPQGTSLAVAYVFPVAVEYLCPEPPRYLTCPTDYAVQAASRVTDDDPYLPGDPYSPPSRENKMPQSTILVHLTLQDAPKNHTGMYPKKTQ